MTTSLIHTLICLIILTSECVHSKVIIVNSNNGNDNTECCVNGECTCSSLSTALLNIDNNNTIISITSESVALNNTTTMGSGKLTNITITGSNVTIMCNNSGSVYCESCDDVIIEGITWDRCGDPNGTNIAGVTFNGTSNISLVNCTFQHSQLSAVSLLGVSDNILIQGCKFLSNSANNAGVLNISRDSFNQLLSHSNNTVIISINEGYFYNTSCCGVPPINIYIDDNSVANCTIAFRMSTFLSNQVIFFLHVKAVNLINIQLTEVSAFKNSHGLGLGVITDLLSTTGDVFLSINSSNFNGNNGSNMWCDISGNTVTVWINNSKFTNSKPGGIDIKVPILYISTTANSTSDFIFEKVQFKNNVIAILPAEAKVDVTGSVSIVASKGNLNIKMLMVDFISNHYLGLDGGAFAVLLPYKNCEVHSIIITDCKFINNKSPGHGAALYIDTRNDNDNIQIENTIFDHNVGGNSVVYLQGFLHLLLRSNPINYNQPVIINNSNFTNNVGSSIYLSSCDVKLSGNSLFKNNTAENGGAMYVDQETPVTIDDKATVHFISNTARLNGGAIYVNILCSHHGFGDYRIINTFRGGSDNAIFVNNSASIGYNSLYFNIPRSLDIEHYCKIFGDINSSHSILYVPCQFNYSQPVNGKMMNISCDLEYTLLNGTGAPIVTSPYELRLYFPFNDGHNISSTSVIMSTLLETTY